VLDNSLYSQALIFRDISSMEERQDHALVLLSATEAKLLAAPVANANNLTVVFLHLNARLPRRVLLAALQCGRCYFGTLRDRGDLSSGNKSGATASLVAFQQWCRERFAEFVDSCLALVRHDSAEVQVAALLSVLEFTSCSTFESSKDGAMPSTESIAIPVLVFKRLSCQLTISDALLELVKHEMFQATNRVRSLRAMSKAIKLAPLDVKSGMNLEDQADNFITLLALIDDMPSNSSGLSDQIAGAVVDDGSSESESESEDEDISSERKRKRAKKVSKPASVFERQLTKHRRAYEVAWLACLKLPMRPQTYKRVLLRLPEYVMPHMPSPLKLSDFLTDSYNIGGLTSILALSGLFILMRCHNLDYPRFYESLYSTLTPSVFYSKHRARYFRLLNLCLSSTNLPAYVVAAFLKKLGRLALGAPPTGAMYVLALTKNLLQKHSAAMPLIQKKAPKADENASADPFDATASTPLSSQALESSLWELHALRTHYYPGVSVLCKELERKWDKHEAKLPMNEYTSQTYRQIYDLEALRKTKSTPLSFKKPAVGLWSGGFHSGIFSIDVDSR